MVDNPPQSIAAVGVIQICPQVSTASALVVETGDEVYAGYADLDSAILLRASRAIWFIGVRHWAQADRAGSAHRDLAD